MSADAKQDAWIAVLIGTLAGMLVVRLYNAVRRIAPDATLIELNGRLFGKWAGLALSLLYTFFTFIFASDVLFYLGNFLTTQVLPRTPIQMLNIIFMLVVVMGVRLGIETLARAAEVMFPWFILLFLALAVFSLPLIRIENIQPVMEAGAKPILRASITFLSFSFFSLFSFLMLPASYMNHPKKAEKAFYSGGVTSGLMLFIIVGLAILVLGPDITAIKIYPSYTLARKISIGHFLQRMEALIAIIWLFSLYFKLCLYFHATVHGVYRILKLRDTRAVIVPLGILVALYSLVVFPSTTYQQTFDTKIWIPCSILLGLVYPLVLLGVSRLRKAGGAEGS
ncbi:endospore germination permease [Paenibacillus sp. P26]|nr:endospore germination permease [Paenibacillus sp. P26]